MNTKKPAGEVTVVTGASKGIAAATIARLIRRRSVVDIVERFQRQHALQEEREIKNLHPSTNGAVPRALPDGNETAKDRRSEESSPPHSGLIVGRLHLSG